MKTNENQTVRGSKKPWFPEDVYGVKAHSLKEEEKTYLLEIAEATKHQNRDDFIEEIEIIIGGFHAEQEFLDRTKPTKVRDRLEKLQKHANLLMHAIENLDKYSMQLLLKFEFSLQDLSGDEAAKQRLSEKIRGPDWSRPLIEKLDDGTIDFGVNQEKCKGFTFEEASMAIASLSWHVENALERIKEYEINRRLPELGRKHLAYNTAIAIKDILGVEPTKDIDGRFANVLRAVMDCADISTKKGVDPENRDVRDLISYALKEIKAQQNNPPEIIPIKK